MSPKDWPKFQENVKKLHSADIYETEPQIKQKRYPQQTPVTIHPIYLKKVPNLKIKNTSKKKNPEYHQSIHQFPNR